MKEGDKDDWKYLNRKRYSQLTAKVIIIHKKGSASLPFVV